MASIAHIGEGYLSSHQVSETFETNIHYAGSK